MRMGSSGRCNKERDGPTKTAKLTMGAQCHLQGSPEATWKI
jgi:hypothetical protein